MAGSGPWGLLVAGQPSGGLAVAGVAGRGAGRGVVHVATRPCIGGRVVGIVGGRRTAAGSRSCACGVDIGGAVASRVAVGAPGGVGDVGPVDTGDADLVTRYGTSFVRFGDGWSREMVFSAGMTGRPGRVGCRTVESTVDLSAPPSGVAAWLLLPARRRAMAMA